MVKWILLFIAVSGHVNADISRMEAEVFSSKQECKQQGRKMVQESSPYDRPHFVCFPVEFKK